MNVIEELKNLLADADHVPHYAQGIQACIARLQDLESTGYLGDLYRTDYIVTGRGPFPVDMLRYTNSWPHGESDTKAIEDSIEMAAYDDPFTITLTKYHRDPTPQLAGDRWLSKFRWKVTGEVETSRL